MAFTVTEFEDMLSVLEAQPEWRERLRSVLLGGEFGRLPQIVAELAQAQQRTERRVAELAEAQQRTERRVEELTEAQQRTERRVEELAATVANIARQLADLAESVRQTDRTVRRLGIRVDAMDGRLLEMQFRDRAPAYFGPWLRRPRVVEADDLDGVDAAIEAGAISEGDFQSLTWLDAIVRGGDKREPGRPETLLALEVSVTVDTEDVRRASARAAILRRAGYRAFGAVGGEVISEPAERLAASEGVVVRLVMTESEPRERIA